jgi:hypothetical protein
MPFFWNSTDVRAGLSKMQEIDFQLVVSISSTKWLNFFFQYFLTKIFNLMKKVIFENGLRAFLATFCFLLLGAVAVNAQGKLTSVASVPGVSNPPAPSSPIYDVPQGTFVSNSQAIIKMDGALVLLKADMAQFINEPAVFNALLIKYKYFGKVQENLQLGATTANAIAAGMWIFLESAEMGSTPASTQQALKNEVINLLKI